MAITIEKLKENFAKNGQTLAQWARENGFKPRDVYLVVGGLPSRAQRDGDGAMGQRRGLQRSDLDRTRPLGGTADDGGHV